MVSFFPIDIITFALKSHKLHYAEVNIARFVLLFIIHFMYSPVNGCILSYFVEFLVAQISILKLTIHELTEDLLAAPSACAEVKEAAQAYPDATGTEKEAATWERN